MIVTPIAPGSLTPDTLLDSALIGAVERLDIRSRKILAGTLPGERRSKRRGRSVEFDDYRTYVPGDDPRHLDWNVLARLDRLFVKIFREDEDLGVTIVVDASPSMRAGAPSKLLFSLRAGASLGYLSLAKQNRVSCAVFGGPGGFVRLAPCRGRASVSRLTRALIDGALGSRDLPAGPPLGLNDALRRVSAAGAGRGVVIVFSDFLVREGWLRGLNALFGAGGDRVDAWIMHVVSRAEVDPAHEAGAGLAGDLRLMDSESPDAAEVTLSRALVARYRARVEAHAASLRADCRARGMHYRRVVSDTPVADLLLTHLRREGLLG